jgi:hypothetical protein
LDEGRPSFSTTIPKERFLLGIPHLKEVEDAKKKPALIPGRALKKIRAFIE